MKLTTDISVDVEGNDPYTYFQRQMGVQPTVILGYDQQSSGNFSLTDSTATPVQISGAQIASVRWVYVEVNNPTMVSVSDGTNTNSFLVQPATLAAPMGAMNLGKLLLETEVVSVSVQAVDSTLPVYGTYCIAGFSASQLAALGM